MFGFGKEKKPELVGAKEKLKRAQMLKKGMSLDEIKSKREGKQNDSPAAMVLLLYFIACAVAYFFSEGPWKSGAPFKSGHPDIDYLLFNSSAPSVFGDPALDYAVMIALRGLFLFGAAGVLPGLAYLWILGLDKTNMNPYRTVWGVPLGLGLVYFVGIEILWPALVEIAKMF